MWRLCDLHNHTTPNEQDGAEFDPDAFVRACLAEHLHVIAVTDHDDADHVAAVQEAAAAEGLEVVPGVEISTDHGHVLALAPGTSGLTVISDLMARLGVRPDFETSLDALAAVASDEVDRAGHPYSDTVVLIGAHVDQPGSMLAAEQPLGLEGQLRNARRMHALEVVSDAIREEWMASGVKQRDREHTVLRGSDSHSTTRVSRATWLYLPELDTKSLRHALATPEASVRFDLPEVPPGRVIMGVTFEGGTLDGCAFNFCERANAIVGPPSSGKSLVLDAIRFVFGIECDIEEIRANASARLARCLPSGSTVRVRVRCDADEIELARTVGGAHIPTPPFQPIIFSQTELVRRAMEARPSMALLDVHCTEARDRKHALAALSADIGVQFDELLEQAVNARALAERVRNPVDGLGATASAITSLAGSESLARQALDVERVNQWRASTRSAVSDWRTRLDAPATPLVPPRPQLESTDLDADRFMPTEVLTDAAARFRDRVLAAADDLTESVEAGLSADDAALIQASDDATTALAAEGIHEGTEVLDRLGVLRSHLVAVEVLNADLTRLEAEIDARLAALVEQLEELSDRRDSLRSARKETCRRVNESMRTFFVRLGQDTVTEKLDGSLADAKVGTGMWTASMAEVRNSLDRARILAYAVRWTQGGSHILPSSTTTGAQDAVVAEALRRGKRTQLVVIATTWPGDSLVIAQRTTPPVEFQQLTEGMRALAIKEVSFAASDLPVVTDQPEDAVPPQAVFESLVPTIRSQRARRQFLLASHDANIVVAGDVEQICVMGGDDMVVGSLFDARIRAAALELLEGGHRAFQLRSRRYGASRD